MSGICGIIDLTGATPDPDQLRLMTDVLERRGPDGTHSHVDGVAALGHTLLATTPEALVEKMPFSDNETGCAITADVRLDNREELLPALGLVDEQRVIGDGELILRAYLMWGDDCVDHFLGDFAFAIWDPRGQRLFCGRDHFGMRQLIYHHDVGQVFAFATEPGAILALDRITKRVNDVRIADFLEGLESVDMKSTFFEGIYRMPAAHVMVLDGDGLQIRRYWTLKAVPELKLDSDEAYEAAFIEVFTEAVRCRLRSAKPVGSMLSGGMDSGSVVAIASELLAEAGTGPLKTFSAVGSDANTCVETKGVHAALGMPGIDAHLVNYQDFGDYIPDLITLTEQIGDPFDTYMTLPLAIYLCANRTGSNVVLDGVLGDVAFLPGSQMVRLVKKGHWRQAWREARGQELYWGRALAPKWRSLLRAVWGAFAPRTLRNYKSRKSAKSAAEVASKTSILSVEIARKTGIAARRESEYLQNRVSHVCYGEERALMAVRPFVTAARERYDRVAAALAVESRDPFADLRVVKFCLSLPGRYLETDGWPKTLLRRSMAGRLSDSTRWQLGKGHLGRQFSNAMLTQWPNLQEEITLGLEKSGNVIRPEFLSSSKTLDAPVIAPNVDDLSEENRQVFFLHLWTKSWRLIE